MKHFKTNLVFLFLLLSPVLATARDAPADVRGVIALIIALLSRAILVGWALLGLGFIYGVFKFLSNFDNEKEREEGKRMMLWSIISVSVLVMIWGILTVMNNTFFSTGVFGIPFLTSPS